MSLIAAKISGNQIQASSKGIGVAFLGWINDSRLIIVEIPYFGFNHTKCVFNKFIKVFDITYRPSGEPPITIVAVPYVIDL